MFWTKRALIASPIFFSILTNYSHAVCTWNGSVGTGWASNANWSVCPSTRPTNGGTAIFPAGALNQTNIQNDGFLSNLALMSFTGGNYSISAPGSMQAASFTLTGGAIATVSFNMPLTANTAIDTAVSTQLTLSGIISNAFSVTKTGVGLLTLSGANTYSAGTNIQAGTLAISAANNIGAGPASISFTTSNGTLEFLNTFTLARTLTIATGITGTLQVDPTFTTTISGIISGLGAVAKTGTGTLVLSAANTYSGGTTVSAGILQGDTTSLQGNILDNAAVVFDQAAGGTYAGAISGTGTVTKQNAGTLTFSGANTYTGATLVSVGTLQAGAANTFSSASDYTVTSTLDLNNLSQTIGSLSGAGSVTLGSATLQVGNANSTTFSGVISGTGALTKLNASTLTLSGSNTYTGATLVGAGTLRAGAANSFAPSSDYTVTSTLDLNSFAQTIGSLAGAGNVTLGSATLQVGNATSTTFSGVISGTGALTKINASTLTLSGANTYTGATLVSAGTLRAGAVNSFAPSSDYTVTSTLDLNNFSQIIGSLAGAGSVTLGSATLQVGNANSTTFSGVISGTGALTKVSSSTLILTGANTYSGGTTISAGVLQGSSTSLQGNILDNASLVFDQAAGGTYAGAISGSGTVTKQNAGTLTFTGANTYTGATLVNVGTLQAGAVNTFSSASDYTVTSTLDLNNFSQIIGSLAGAGSVTLGSANLQVGNATSTTFSGVISGTGSLTKVNASTLTLSGSNTYTGATLVSAGTLRAGAVNSFAPASDYTVTSTLDLNNFSQIIGSLAGAGSVTLGSATLQVGNATSTTFSGVISGTGSLTKVNASTLTLSGSNTYTGATLVSAGTLRAGAANSFAPSSDYTVTSTLDLNNFSQIIGSLAGAGSVTLGSANLQVGNANSTTFSGVISGTGSLTKVNASTLTLSGSNTYTGATLVSAGTLRAGAANSFAPASDYTVTSTLDLNNFSQIIGSLAGAGSVTLGSGTLQVGNATSTTFSGVISGTGALTKVNASTLTLSGSNTYTGATLVSAGTLRAGAVNSFAPTSDYTVTSTLDLNNFSQVIGSLAGAGSVTLGSATLQVGNANSTTFSGVISGTGALTKVNASTLTLSGSNTYTGATLVSAGTLQAGAVNSFAPASNYTVTTTLDLNNFSQIIGSLSGAGNVTLGSATLQVGNAISTTFSGVISGTGALTKVNASTLTLSGSNTYTGATLVSAGTLRAGAANSFAPSSDYTVTSTLDLNNFSQVIGSLAGAGSVTLGSGTLQVGNANSTTFSGVISGTGALTKVNASTLTLSGSNTYTGATLVSAGTLQAGAANSFAPSSDYTVTSTLDLNNFSQIIGSLAGAGSVTLGSGTLQVGNANSTTFSGVISGTGALTKVGSSTLILTGANTYSGGTTISTGVLQGSATSLQGNILDNASLVFDQAAGGTYAGAISGSGTVTKQNAGTLTFTGANTYTGATLVNVGTLQAGAVNTFSSASDYTVTSTLDLNNFSQIIGSLSGAGNVTLGTANLQVGNANSTTFSGAITGTGSLTKVNASTLILTGTNTYSGGTTVTGGVLQGNTTSLQGNITNNASLVFDQAALGTYAGIISGTGSLTKQNAGTLILGGSNTYTGVTFVTGGAIQAGAVNALAPNSDYTLNPATTLNLNNFSQVIGSLAGFGNVVLGSANLQVGNANSTTFAGVISGTGSLTKVNASTLILTGANTYSGGTTISGGVLQGNTTSLQGNIVDNASLVFDQAADGTYSGTISGTGSVTKQNVGNLIFSGNNTYTGTTNVNAGILTVNGAISNATILNVAFGATLKGTGLVSGVGSISGTVQPGNSVGTLTLAGNQTFNSGSTLDIEVTPTASSLLIINPGSLTILPGSTLHLSVDDGIYTNGTVFTIVQTPAGTVSGIFSSVTSSMPLIGFTVQYLVNEIDILLGVIPFSTVVTSGNAGKVAICIDQLKTTATGDLANVINTLGSISSVAELQKALNQMAPAVYTDLALAQQNNTFRMRSSISTRLEQVYETACTLQNEHSHVWADAYGDWIQEDGNKNKIGYHASTGGVLLGYDYTIANHFVVGAGVAYSYSDLDFSRNRGSGHIQSYYGTVYAGFFQKYLFVNAMVTGAYNDYEAHRKIQFSDINRKASSHPQGSEVAGHLDLGFLYKANHFLISPFGMLDYVHLHQDSFKERGAQSLNVKVRDKNADMLRAEAGLQASYCISRERYKMRPYAKLSWVGEYRYDGKHEKASLEGTNCTFNVTGLYPNRNLIAPGAGLTAYLGQDRYYLSLNYEGEFGHNYSDNKANVQVSFGF